MLSNNVYISQAKMQFKFTNILIPFELFKVWSGWSEYAHFHTFKKRVHNLKASLSLENIFSWVTKLIKPTTSHEKYHRYPLIPFSLSPIVCVLLACVRVWEQILSREYCQTAPNIYKHEKPADRQPDKWLPTTLVLKANKNRKELRHMLLVKNIQFSKQCLAIRWSFFFVSSCTK